jgi:hypothetical protein
MRSNAAVSCTSETTHGPSFRSSWQTDRRSEDRIFGSMIVHRNQTLQKEQKSWISNRSQIQHRSHNLRRHRWLSVVFSNLTKKSVNLIYTSSTCTMERLDCLTMCSDCKIKNNLITRNEQSTSLNWATTNGFGVDICWGESHRWLYSDFILSTPCSFGGLCWRSHSRKEADKPHRFQTLTIKSIMVLIET